MFGTTVRLSGNCVIVQKGIMPPKNFYASTEQAARAIYYIFLDKLAARGNLDYLFRDEVNDNLRVRASIRGGRAGRWNDN